MDPRGRTALRFPLLARFRPACLPLPERITHLTATSEQAAREAQPGLGSAVLNQAALLASDVGLPDLAADLCHLHATTYLTTGPHLTATDAIRALEPLVNLGRLRVRAGNGDDGRSHLLRLYSVVRAGASGDFDGITVPADLLATADDREQVREWLWRVLLADGTGTLTALGRWREALDHVDRHHGVGQLMRDGRQVAVITALVAGDTDRAGQLLDATVAGEPWEQAVTDCLSLWHRHQAGLPVAEQLSTAVGTYLQGTAGPGMTVFDIRLGLTILDTVEALSSPSHPDALTLANDLYRRATTASDGYAARETLDHPLSASLLTPRQQGDLHHLQQACGLGAGHLPPHLHEELARAVQTAATVISKG